MAAKIWMSFAALMLSLNALAETSVPSLAPVADALEINDLEKAERLKSELQPYLAQAPKPWQMRWHILGCQFKQMMSDRSALAFHTEQLHTLLGSSPERSHPATGYLHLCRARLAVMDKALPSAHEHVSKAISAAQGERDNNLAIMALVMRANMQSNRAEYSSALEDLSQAMLLAEQPQPARYLSLHPAMLDFSLARTFFYLENFTRADEAMLDALDKATGAPQMTWFIRFNYASVLQRQGRIAESQQQLDQLSNTIPHFAAPDEGYIRYFRAINAFGLARYTEALDFAQSAADTFVLSDLQPEYAQARAIQAQSLLMLGQIDAGWQLMNEVQPQLETLEDYRTLTQLQYWIADYHHQQGADELAYQALLKHLNYQQSFRDQTQQAALLKQQHELGQQMDQHRKSLALTAEAHYQNQQSLMLWQSLASIFGALLLSSLALKFWPRKNSSTAPAPPQTAAEALKARIQQAKHEESPLAVILIRVPGSKDSELRQQLCQDLRDQDSHLQLTPSDHLLLLASASDGELSWRLAALPRQLSGLGMEQFAFGKTRVHSFDSVESLMARLEYDLLSHQSDSDKALSLEQPRLRRIQ
ncbi:hypothetical protein [Ferrimonas gelatinilytica]|uniref:MalT-like TPR region domain-containing protein n=1 Tax=Ferrimonas gelatinilytica TaxID=1255257 RepID=A0ABP9RVD8_9GAMM